VEPLRLERVGFGHRVVTRLDSYADGREADDIIPVLDTDPPTIDQLLCIIKQAVRVGIVELLDGQQAARRDTTALFDLEVVRLGRVVVEGRDVADPDLVFVTRVRRVVVTLRTITSLDETSGELEACGELTMNTAAW